MSTHSSVHSSGTHAITAKTTVGYLDANGFAVVVERAPGLVLVDFTAEWCPPCRILSPHLDALARELPANVVVAKVDVDEQPELAARFGVQGIPAIIFFRDGLPVDRIIGAMPPERLRQRVEEHLAGDGARGDHGSRAS